MGGQYVLGRNIEEGLKRGAKQNDAETRFSFDMLGEGARTDDDAENYLTAYGSAIDSIGKSESNPERDEATDVSRGVARVVVEHAPGARVIHTDEADSGGSHTSRRHDAVV